MKIEDLKAIQILDSRGNPTLKVFATVNGVTGNFSVPSGASTGTHEALELRDGLKAFNGLGVEKAITNVNTKIKDVLIGKDPRKLYEIDKILFELDGTKSKKNLGANAILGASGAIAKATANALNIELFEYICNIFESNGEYSDAWSKKGKYVLPKLFMNVINGGKHAENNVDIQETMIVPEAETIEKRVQIGSEVYHSLKEVVKSKKLSTGLGDEGGFAPDLESNIKAIELIVEAVQRAGYTPGKEVNLALDVAASEIYDPQKDEKYILNSENIGLTSTQMVSMYKELVANYPIISIEDGLAEDDWEGWKSMTERIGDHVQLVGDDLFVTNPERIQRGIDEKAGNAVLIKVNQIGSISETLEAIKLSQKNGLGVMISHRSGETEDTFIADLAVATGAGQIKSGAPARSERTSKYNRLIEIEQILNER